VLPIGQELDHHLTTPLHPPKDWRSCLRQWAPTRLAFEATSTPLSALLLHHFRLTLVAGNPIGFVACHFVCPGHRRLFFTIPHAARGSSGAPHHYAGLMHVLSAHARDAVPCRRDTTPSLAAADDGPHKWCRSEHQSGRGSRYTHSVDTLTL
jgi:hypothetical protein